MRDSARSRSPCGPLCWIPSTIWWRFCWRRNHAKSGSSRVSLWREDRPDLRSVAVSVLLFCAVSEFIFGPNSRHSRPLSRGGRGQPRGKHTACEPVRLWCFRGGRWVWEPGAWVDLLMKELGSLRRVWAIRAAHFVVKTGRYLVVNLSVRQTGAKNNLKD